MCLLIHQADNGQVVTLLAKIKSISKASVEPDINVP